MRIPAQILRFGISLLCACGLQVQAAETSATYTQYVPSEFPPTKSKPQAVHRSIGVDECERDYKAKSFVVYRFEAEALAKARESGFQSLDESEQKWAATYANRETVCLGLLKANNRLGGADVAKTRPR